MKRLATVLSFASILVACALLTSTGARAAAEFCPARLSALSVNGDVALFTVAADTPRSVSGEVLAETDAGWYAWRFPMTVLQQAKERVQAGPYSVDTDTFASAPLAARFPQTVHLIHAFVRQATTSGESVFGWDAEGAVSCDPNVFSAKATLAELPATHSTPAVTVTAEHIDAPFSSTCPVPFAAPSVTQLARISLSADYTASVGNAVIVDVALDKAGKVIDAWLLGSSGNVSYDQAALREAHASTYAPARSYCRDVPAVLALPIRFK